MVDFDELIDSYLAREFRPKKSGRYYPSEVGGCLRKTWFSYKNPKPTETELLRIFESGNILHSFIEDVLKSEKNPNIELLQSELPIKMKQEDYLISGRIDNLILVKIENKRFLVEVKSCKYLPDNYRSEHEMQLQLYMKAIGVYNGILLYIQKDNLQTKTFEIKYDWKLAQKILERFQKIHDSLTQDKMPEAEAKHDKEKEWMCNYCPWKEECWEKED